MSGLGPIALNNQQGSVFLGREMGRASEYSQKTQSEADSEIRRILNEQHDLAKKTVQERREQLENLAQALLEFESLGNVETLMALDMKTLEDIRVHREAKAAQATSTNADTDAPLKPAESEEAAVPLGGEMPEPATRDRLS